VSSSGVSRAERVTPLRSRGSCPVARRQQWQFVPSAGRVSFSCLCSSYRWLFSQPSSCISIHLDTIILHGAGDAAHLFPPPRPVRYSSLFVVACCHPPTNNVVPPPALFFPVGLHSCSNAWGLGTPPHSASLPLFQPDCFQRANFQVLLKSGICVASSFAVKRM